MTALKRSTKGVMNSSFGNAPYTKPSTSKTAMEMQFVMNLLKVLLKFIRETSKVAALKSIKPSIGKTIQEMQFFLELSKLVFEFVSETSSK